MARFGTHGWRCDYCGKFTKARDREYLRKDGSAGYIWPETDADENQTGKDICEECSEARELDSPCQ